MSLLTSVDRVPDTGNLRFRKLADKTRGERVTRYNPITGAKFLVDPSTGNPSPWPTLGVIALILPRETGISTRLVETGIREGWISVEESRVEMAPGGPPSDPYRKRHIFRKGDVLVLKCLDEVVRYEITRQPGPNSMPTNDRVQVTWDYRLKLISRTPTGVALPT